MITREFEELCRDLKMRSVHLFCEGNSFVPVFEEDMLIFEQDTGVIFPEKMRYFYTHVGWGFLNKNKYGNRQLSFPNSIMNLDRIRKFVNRTEISFEYDEDIIGEDEIAFFDIGDFSYFVFRQNSENPDHIYYPGDKNPLARDFEDFISKLYENTTFYLDHESVFE